MYLSIIIPLYNEEKLVTQVLDKLFNLRFPSFVENYEIIVVDDSSTDNSYNTVKKYSETHSNIFCLKHEKNKGKGAAVKTGISAANGDVFLIQDADLELSPDDIPRMLFAMHNLNVDFVNGSRYLSGIDRPLSSFSRYIGNKIFTILTAIIINVKISDMACGYKLFKKELYDKLSLKENRFGFEAEIILKALKSKKIKIAEIPVQYFPRSIDEGKKLKTWDAVKVLFKIIKYGLFNKK